MSRIGFCGSHGTGKSSLLREMISWPELCGHAFVSGLTRRQAQVNGIVINQDGTFQTQSTLIKALGKYVHKLPDLVIDRTGLDIYAYTLYALQRELVTKKEVNTIRGLARRAQHQFDFVFYIRPEFKVEEDGVRSGDPVFAADMVRIFERVVMTESLGTKRMILVSGTIEERLAIVREAINDHKI